MMEVIVQKTAIGWYNVHSESATINIDPATMLEHFALEGFTRKLYRATIEISQERFEALGGVQIPGN